MLFIVASVTAEARPIFPINWNNFTQGNASVNFTSQSNFSIYDQGVNWAEISANLGTLGPGTINLSFSYSTTSNGWWENVYAGYLSGTAPVVADLNPAPWLNSYLPYTSNMTPISGINISAYSTNAGTITTSFAVNGATSLNFGAYPNYWSAMPDHMGTTLTITGLNIDYVADAVATTTKWEGQSPVDFNATNTVQVPNNAPIQYFYTTDTITLKNTADSTVGRQWGSLIASPATANSYITVNGEKYVLSQFHFHTQSEHTVNGIHTPMEMHLVHLKVHDNGQPYCAGEPGSVLVISAFIKEGASNPELNKIFGLPGLETLADGATYSGAISPVNMKKLLPNVTSSYRYHGSFTEPTTVACDASDYANINYNSNPTGQLNDHSLGNDGSFPEAVSWVVLSTPITMSHTQIGVFQKLFPVNSTTPDANSRQTQNLDHAQPAIIRNKDRKFLFIKN